MRDGEFWKLSEPVRLGQQDALLKQLAAGLPTNINNAFMLPNAKAVHIQTRSDVITAWTELGKVLLSTVYTANRDGSVHPLFKPKPVTSPPEHEATMEWVPAHARMRLFFVTVFNQGGGLYAWKSSYLIAKHPQRKEIFRPPLPNIFNDARLCMGNSYVGGGICLADAFLHSLNHINQSKWNSDAMEGMDEACMKALYTFNKDGKQVPTDSEYKWYELPCCRPVNNLYYGELPIV